MDIYVKAVNELGEATSAHITLEPVSAGEDYRKCAFILLIVVTLVVENL